MTVTGFSVARGALWTAELNSGLFCWWTAMFCGGLTGQAYFSAALVSQLVTVPGAERAAFP